MTLKELISKVTPKTEQPNDATSPNPMDVVTSDEPPVLTPEQIKDLKAKAAKADESWDRLLRATADFENFKKRATRERQEAIKFGNEALLRKMINVLDNFDMALAAASDQKNNSVESLATGINMIHQQFKNILAEAGVEEIDAAGKAFDPNWHEAVAQEETGDLPEGQVIRQHRIGYKLRDRLIRPASVVVAIKPAT